MAEQDVSINFAQGLNTKLDPWQLPIGQFLSLENIIFQTGGLIKKRPGYPNLVGLDQNSSYLTTLNNNLLSIGNTVSAYSDTLEEWITKGNLQPCSLSVLPLIRNSVNQIQSDTAIGNGLVLTVYTEENVTNSAVVTQYLFAVADVTTGQNIVEPTLIPALSGGAISGSSRAFVLGNFFIIISQVLISASTYLQYVSIPIYNPVSPLNIPNISTPQNVHSETYAPVSSNPGWDGIVSNQTLVVAYRSVSGGQGVHVAALTQANISSGSAASVFAAFTGANNIAGIISCCTDTTNNVYISFWNPSNSTGYIFSVIVTIASITTNFAPVVCLITTGPTPIINIASAFQNGQCTVFFEVAGLYDYDSNLSTNLVERVVVSSAGSLVSSATVARGIGLASKPFIQNGTIYFLAAYMGQSVNGQVGSYTYGAGFQPTYFLMNGSLSTQAVPVVVAKLAYQNGGGYVSLGLPSAMVVGDVAQLSYLYKDNVQALNTQNNPQQKSTIAAGIYSQTGINLVSFDTQSAAIGSEEIAGSLHIQGGFLGMFDGYLPVEHNFFLFPDAVECFYTEVSTVTPTGTTVSGSNVITGLSSVSGIAPNMTISGTNIPTGAIVVLVGVSTITINLGATGSGSVTLTIQGNIAAVPTGGIEGAENYWYISTYEWPDNNGLTQRSAPSVAVPVSTAGTGTTGSIIVYIPTLRLTSKVANPLKIVIYRWSEFTQVYNQVTSITAPILNDTTVDSIAFVDTLPDADVVGNNILYTTGGVVPDTNGPAFNAMTLFDTRLWGIPAEDPNTFWISKTVVEGAPVEMSTEFTIYVAPNIGTTGSSGPMTAAAPMDDKIVIFKKNSIFFINGTGPDNLGTTSVGCPLGNYSQPTFITSVVGCVNQNSIVLTQDGLMFQSDKGIWIVRRNLSMDYIGAPVEAYNSSTITSAQVIPGTNYVVFTLNTGGGLMYDYYYGQWGTFSGFTALSSCIYNGMHTILNPYGGIQQATANVYIDGTNPVLMQFTTSWLNLASLQGYQRFYELYLLAKYLSPHQMAVQVAYDYNPSLFHQSIIKPKNFSSAIPSSFGVPVPFGAPRNLEQWRVHAKQQLCQSFQLSVQEVFDSTLGVPPGPGFTMSGITAKVDIKRSRRPIAGATSIG